MIALAVIAYSLGLSADDLTCLFWAGMRVLAITGTGWMVAASVEHVALGSERLLP